MTKILTIVANSEYNNRLIKAKGSDWPWQLDKVEGNKLTFKHHKQDKQIEYLTNESIVLRIANSSPQLFGMSNEDVKFVRDKAIK